MCFFWFLNKHEIIRWEDTEEFVPPVNKGIVIKVYDGDTITIASKLPIKKSPLYRFSVRLAGIDTPEIHGPFKEKAILAKNTLSNLVLNKEVHLKNIRNEKYGRILADVFVNDLNVNMWMLDHNHAVVYSGGKKEASS
jgi:micrococcal nuclease